MTKRFIDRRIITLVLFILTVPLTAIEKGESMHGFTLLEKRFVEEVNTEVLYFKHDHSGARLVKIAADDPNKTFSISFKTICNSDAGTPHILEHSVLNGSRHFPVKSPFDVLAKGSLNTFLNAMTGSDITMYPVASMNTKDYFNLMHIYLDAVFYPLIYEDPLILKQEGWHRELLDPAGEINLKGVVYNEMKGSFSNPTREVYYQAKRLLFPDTPYRFSSGGYPADIPTLTQETFLDFHRTYYHPENAYILLYGDADLDRELAFINDEYLSAFEMTGTRIEMPKQSLFTEPRTKTLAYPIPSDGEIEDQTYLTLNWITGDVTDRELVMGLQIIQRVLISNETGALRAALQEAKIGKDVRSSLDDLQQNFFQIQVPNANPEDADRFLEIVRSTLEKVVADGLDREAVAGALNRFSFSLREGNDAQKGLSYNWRMMGSWFWADDPFASLEFEKTLAALEKDIPNGYLEGLIQTYLLDNQHRLELVMVPQPGLETERNEKLAFKLAQYKTRLNPNQLEDLLQETQNLLAKQSGEDSPEALATIPLLALEDIDPQTEWYPLTEKKVARVPYLQYTTFTNNVVYTRLQFDLRVLPENLIPYAALLAEVLGAMDTEHYGYGDLDKQLDLQIGGFSTFLTRYLGHERDEELIPKFVVASKAANTKQEQQFNLMSEIIRTTVYTDTGRLKDLLTRHQARLESRVKSDGLGYALTRLNSYYRQSGVFDEKTSGLEYYQFITKLVESFDSNSHSIVTRLQKTAEMLFTRENLLATVTCAEGDTKEFRHQLKVFAKSLPRAEADYQSWRLRPSKANEGLLAASKVQYVVQGYDFRKLGKEWNGSLRVANQVISREWLQQQVRVKGGAYGGWASIGRDGTFYLGSYRDPNLAETLENFDGTVEFLRDFEADDQEMTRFIIGTIARMDRPLTPSQKGNVAVSNHLEGISREMLQADRDAVLSTTPADLRQVADLLSSVLAKEAYCVYGNEKKLQENSTLFGKLVPTVE